MSKFDGERIELSDGRHARVEQRIRYNGRDTAMLSVWRESDSNNVFSGRIAVRAADSKRITAAMVDAAEAKIEEANGAKYW